MTAFPVVVRVAGVDLDNCNVALPLEITHGRSGVDTQPDAPTCTFTWLGATAPIALGDSLEVEVSGVAGARWTDPNVFWSDPEVSWLGTRGRSLRFKGSINSLKAVEALGNVVAWQVEAVGEQARLGRIPVLLSRPQETDVDRVTAIAADAGVPIVIMGSPGPTLLADNIDRDALSALHEVCASSGGLLWQRRDGVMVYGTIYRHEEMPLWRIACTTILDGIEWQNDSDRVLNHVVVKFGSPETQNTYRDDDSIAQWGYKHVEIGTMCANDADAAMLGVVVLARRKQPRWVMPGVVILRDKSTASQWSQFQNADFGHSVMLDVTETPLPTPGAPTPWTLEGWVETWESAGRRVQLAVSEYRLGVPITWDAARQEKWAYWTGKTWLQSMVEV